MSPNGFEQRLLLGSGQRLGAEVGHGASLVASDIEPFRSRDLKAARSEFFLTWQQQAEFLIRGAPHRSRITLSPWRRHVMKPIGIVLSLAVLVTAGRASAVVIEVPLPGLVGTYAETARTAEFQLPALSSVIHSVSLRVHGTARIAYFSCDGPGGYGDPVPVPIQINASMFADPGYWLASHNDFISGEIGWTEAFEPLWDATWSFLMDGKGEIW